MKEFTRVRAAEPLPGRTSPALNGALSRLDRIHFLAVALALGLTAFLAIEPTQNWLLLLVVGLAGLGADGIVRTHPRARFQRLDDTALFLFVPVLFALSAGLFLEEVAEGYWSLAGGFASLPAFWMILWAEYESVDRRSDRYHRTRLWLNVATYFIAFLFFATVFDFELSLVEASFAAGVVSLLLGIEVLREEALDTSRTILYAGAIGLLLAEAAWSTDFLPLEGWSAAFFLLAAFYLMTGMMHHYLANRLNTATALEFGAVALAVLSIVTIAQVVV